jgi:hypothetical protein
MAIDTQRPLSRRGLLAALAGGTAAALAGVASRAERAFGVGSDGETVVIGGVYADVRTPINLSREEDPNRPMLRIGMAVPGGGLTEVGAGEVSLSQHNVLTDQYFILLKPARIEMGTDERFGGGTHRTVIASTGISTRHLNVFTRKRTAIEGTGRIGGSFAGRQAQIRLEASRSRTHPDTGVRGDLFVDATGRLWFCKGGRAWRKLA